MPQARAPSARDIALLIGGQMCIGAAGLFGRMTLADVSGLSACAWRMLLAAGLLAAWQLAGRALGSRMRRAAAPGAGAGWRLPWLLAPAGLTLALHFAAWIRALAELPVALASLLVASSPLWHLLLAAALERRRPPAAFVAALGISAVGTALTLAPGGAGAGWQGGTGVAWALAGGLMQALHLMVIARLLQGRAGQGAPATINGLLGWSYAVAAVLLGAAAAVDGAPMPGRGQARAWVGIVGMAVCSQVVGHTTVNRALLRFPAGQVVLTTLIRPLFAALLASLVLGERLAPSAYLGAVLVAVGLALALSAGAAQDTGAPRPRQAAKP